MRLKFPLTISMLRRGGVRLSRLMHPAREWFTCLVVVLVTLACGLWYSGTLFVTQIQTDYLAMQSAQTQPEAYKHGAVEKALTTYRARTDAFHALSARPPAPTPAATTTAPVAEEVPVPVE